MRAAWRLERLARFPRPDYESAARSLREGMAEPFTLRLELSPSLYKCLATTNLTESPRASAWLLTENRFREISAHPDLWAPATILRRKTGTEISQEKAA